MLKIVSLAVAILSLIFVFALSTTKVSACEFDTPTTIEKVYYINNVTYEPTEACYMLQFMDENGEGYFVELFKSDRVSNMTLQFLKIVFKHQWAVGLTETNGTENITDDMIKDWYIMN
ncbi:MAG TPA: hypothetical protein VFK73_06950 [Paludibacter sp.]|nr:hypothetical protein [Paludibacter sp.]